LGGERGGKLSREGAQKQGLIRFCVRIGNKIKRERERWWFREKIKGKKNRKKSPRAPKRAGYIKKRVGTEGLGNRVPSARPQPMQDKYPQKTPGEKENKFPTKKAK